MSDDIITPHPRLPFTFTDDGDCLLVEQDSDAEIQQCVYGVLAYEPGQLLVNPDFGTPSQVFKKGGVNIQQLQGIIQIWESRADEIIDRDPFWFEKLVDTVTLRRDPANG